MMKEQYIKQVGKELHVPCQAKKDIIRDLNEIFNSALENGETEQQVINRLGTPKEFAENTAEQLGIDFTASKKLKGTISYIVAFAVAVVAFVIYGTTQVRNVPQGTIGQADAMTSIKLDSTFGIDISVIFLLIGIVATVIAVIQIIRSIRKNRRYS